MNSILEGLTDAKSITSNLVSTAILAAGGWLLVRILKTGALLRSRSQSQAKTREMQIKMTRLAASAYDLLDITVRASLDHSINLARDVVASTRFVFLLSFILTVATIPFGKVYYIFIPISLLSMHQVSVSERWLFDLEGAMLNGLGEAIARQKEMRDQSKGESDVESGERKRQAPKTAPSEVNKPKKK